MGGGSNEYPETGIIRNNRVFLAQTPADAQQYPENAINNGWSYDLLIEGNYVDGASCGVYSDTGGCTNLMITHNFFRNCYQGVALLSPYNRENVTIDFNMIDLWPTTSYVSAGFHFDSALTNVFIFGNTVDFTGPGSSTAVAINTSSLVGLVFANNSVDATLANNQAGSSYLSNVSNLSMYNNNDLFGNYLWALNIPTLGGVDVSPLGLNIISSTQASTVFTNLGLPSNPDFAQYSDPAPTFTNGMNIGTQAAYQIGGGNVLWASNYCGNSLVATNGFQCATNYVPSNWTPVPGSVILRASNNWMFAITARSTNAVFKFGP